MSDKLSFLAQFQGHPVVEASMLTTSVGTLGGLLPELAAVLPVIWYSIQIAESKAAKRLYAWLRSFLISPLD